MRYYVSDKKHSISDISLSRNAVMRRTEEISKDLKQQLINSAKTFITFSLALDESIDIKDVSQYSFEELIVNSILLKNC